MMVTFISQCEKNALKKSRRVLDAFAAGGGKMPRFARRPGEWFAVVFEAIREMMHPPTGKNHPIGFVHGEEKKNG